MGPLRKREHEKPEASPKAKSEGNRKPNLITPISLRQNEIPLFFIKSVAGENKSESHCMSGNKKSALRGLNQIFAR